MKLQGHHGEVWALAIAKHGSFVVTGSHDRSLRIWEKTDEQVIFCRGIKMTAWYTYTWQYCIAFP